MQTGLHIIERTRWEGRAPGEGRGVVDFCRMVGGFDEEPTEDDPVVVVGLESFLAAGAGELADRVAPLRRAIHRGKHYFEWKALPVVFLVRGSLVGHEGKSPVLTWREEDWDLEPLFGGGLQPSEQGEIDWWYSPQFD